MKENATEDTKTVVRNPKIEAKKSAKNSTKKVRKSSNTNRKSQKVLPLVNVNKITNYFEPKNDPLTPQIKQTALWLMIKG